MRKLTVLGILGIVITISWCSYIRYDTQLFINDLSNIKSFLQEQHINSSTDDVVKTPTIEVTDTKQVVQEYVQPLSQENTSEDRDNIENSTLTKEEIAFINELKYYIEVESEVEKALQDFESSKIAYGEMMELVLKNYRLLDILNEYGATFAPNKDRGNCPICGTADALRIMGNASTGFEFWGCEASICGSNSGDSEVELHTYNVIDFVVQMEGLEDEIEAIRYLSKRNVLIIE